MRLLHAARAILAAGLCLTGCADESEMDADIAARGAAALQRYGCGACHEIPGVAGATGMVGPPLVDLVRRVYIGRGLPNTPENLIQFIRAPQAKAPHSVMPDMQVSATDAADMVTYLLDNVVSRGRRP